LAVSLWRLSDHAPGRYEVGGCSSSHTHTLALKYTLSDWPQWLVLGLAVSLLATPSFAQQSNSGEAGMSSERENALRDRTGQAGKMSQSTWGDQQIHKYRSCMAQHGQQE